MSTKREPTFEGDYTFAQDEPFILRASGSLQPVTLRYALYGSLNAQRDNAILVCHALSGSARVADWWPEMIGEDAALDTSTYCVIGINVIGSCYGSTGPSSLNPQTGNRYGGSFPLVTVSDMVRAQERLLTHLGIETLHAVVGGSIGGMQALEWAVSFPEKVGTCVAVAACPLPAMGLALNHLQRQAIRCDPAWEHGNYAPEHPPRDGLALARALAVCTYKSPELFEQRYGRRPNRSGEIPHRSLNDRFDVAGYLDYQGELFNDRFDANSYLVLSKAMDNFDLSDDSGSRENALRRISAAVLMVGITSDWLFPAAEVESLAKAMIAAGVHAQYLEVESAHGHDGFLADAAELERLIKPRLNAVEERPCLRDSAAVLV